jgi:hypothetical protein
VTSTPPWASYSRLSAVNSAPTSFEIPPAPHPSSVHQSRPRPTQSPATRSATGCQSPGADAAPAPPEIITVTPSSTPSRKNTRNAGTRRVNGATPRATNNPTPAMADVCPRLFKLPTASLPSRVEVSPSIMARSDAENAGTCEYRQSVSSRSSNDPTYCTTSAPAVQQSKAPQL